MEPEHMSAILSIRDVFRDILRPTWEEKGASSTTAGCEEALSQPLAKQTKPFDSDRLWYLQELASGTRVPW